MYCHFFVCAYTVNIIVLIFVEIPVKIGGKKALSVAGVRIPKICIPISSANYQWQVYIIIIFLFWLQSFEKKRPSKYPVYISRNYNYVLERIYGPNN